jgi:thiol:disulfide interchange protein DsbD
MIGVTSVLFAQDSSAVSWKYEIKSIQKNQYQLRIKGTINQGWNLYDSDSIDQIEGPTVHLKPAVASSITKIVSIPNIINDVIYQNKKKVYTNEIILEQQITIQDTTVKNVQAAISYNLSKETNFIPEEHVLLVNLSGNSLTETRLLIPSIDINHPLSNCGVATVENTSSKSLMSLFFIGFIGGLIALLTPCVFPMIPVTVSFFTKRSKTRKHGIQNGLIYGLSIFLIYVLASVPFHIVGNVQPEIFNSISTNAWLNIAFFAIFIFFSISFFGYFEISLPSGIANKADAKSGLGSLGGIFFMAITLAIVSFSCTGPILGTLLVGSLQGGAWALTQGMAGFGFALALPFTLFAIFPQWLQSLPKSGGWLDTVKKVLAFVELALAFKFLSNADLVQHWGLLKREVFIGIWILISLGLSAYLFGFLLLPHDVKGQKIASGRKIIGGFALGFALYLGAGLMPQNANNLKLLSGFPPPTHYSLFASDSSSHGLKADVVNDYNKALAMAKAQQKPILIDFTGWACVNCRKMEEQVWTDPAVQTMIKENFILLSLYVDDRANLPVAERFVYTTLGGQQKQINSVADLWATFETENFNQSSQPLYVVLSPDQVLQSNPIGYTPDIQQYLEWLKCSARKK